MEINHNYNPAASAVKFKSLLWDTDYNHKMGNDSFLHIDLMPQKVSEETIGKEIARTVYIIGTRDNSHQEVHRFMDDIFCLPLRAMLDPLTIASHGMSADQFREWFCTRHSFANSETKLMVCAYSKPENHNVFKDKRKLKIEGGVYYLKS